MRLRPSKKLGQGSPIAEEPPTADDKDEQTEPQVYEHDEDFWKDGRLALGEAIWSFQSMIREPSLFLQRLVFRKR